MIRFGDLVTKAARDLGSSSSFFSNSSSSSSPRSSFSNTQAENKSALLKLDSNENPWGPSPLAIAAMRNALTAGHEYPDDDCSELRIKLAEQHGVRTEQVLVTPGSTGMLSLLCQILLGPGRNAVTSAQSFIVYGMLVRASGARLIETALLRDGFDLEAILGAINAETRLVFLANPNNPTGTLLEAGEIEKFLAAVPEHVIVVLDEAYYEYAAHFAALRKAEYSRSLEYVRRGARVVVVRTFSKVHGLAGLRIGYGMGPPELLGYCARMAHTYGVSSVAQVGALAAMADQAHIKQTVADNGAQAQILTRGLEDLGWRVVPTWANFVYCEIGSEASQFAALMREDGIAIRPLAAWGAPKCIRVTVGKAEQNQRFLDAARRVKSGVI